MTGTWLPWVPWLDVYLWGLWTCAVAQGLFVSFLVTTKWRRWRAGRALFIKSAALAVMLVLTLAAWYALVPHLLEIASVLIWVMAAAITYLLWSLICQKWPQVCQVCQWFRDRRARGAARSR